MPKRAGSARGTRLARSCAYPSQSDHPLVDHFLYFAKGHFRVGLTPLFHPAEDLFTQLSPTLFLVFVHLSASLAFFPPSYQLFPGSESPLQKFGAHISRPCQVDRLINSVLFSLYTLLLQERTRSHEHSLFSIHRYFPHIGEHAGPVWGIKAHHNAA